MRLLPIISLLFVFACTPRPSSSVKFEHPIFNLEYPDNWEKLEEKGMILTISKYSKLKAVKQEANPNLIAVSNDSTHFVNYGITSFHEFLEGFKQSQLNKDNISLEEDLKTVEINGNKVHLIKYKVVGKHLTFLQSQYAFSSMQQYVSILLTHEYGKPNNELTRIINSLEITKSQSLDELLDD